MLIQAIKQNSRMMPVMLMLLMSILVACSPAEAPLNSSSSTPVTDLPISVGNPDPRIDLPTPMPAEYITAADAEYLLLANVYDRVTPSVVNIEADIEGEGGFIVDTSRGSGWVYDAEGHIVTNAHVINDATAVRVTFNTGYVAQGEVIGTDSYSDLGVVKVNVDTERLRPLAMIDSDRVRVGQRAIAIGNPFGLNSSMSVGIISGLGRTLRSAELIDAEAIPGFQNPSIIQTDTPINPGNSGGPLLNSAGEVVAVTTAIRTESGVFQGVGFAVPANTVQRVIPELIAKGRVDYAWMGISVAPEDSGFSVAALAEPLALPVESGVLIRGVTIGSPADRAGLRGGTEIQNIRNTPVCVGGDIVVAVNGFYVQNMDELVAYLVTRTAPGDTVILRVVRDQETFEVPMTLENRPESDVRVRDCEG
jgi:2-alkenal reductase